MTAEIAILNKSAVALAADSAVTISAGDIEQKIYDSAEKLFDLSHHNAIGIMIYHGMQFMQAPLPIVISDYRKQGRDFDHLEDAAYDFLSYLNSWGARSSREVKTASLEAIVEPLVRRINSRINFHLERLFKNLLPTTDPKKEYDRIINRSLFAFERIYDRAKPAQFIGGSPPRITKARHEEIRKIVEKHFANSEEVNINRLAAIASKAVAKRILSGGQTGIVIAGFGNKDIFPSLISFEIDGIVFGKLKYVKKIFVDIDRDGERSRVLPFAQKEMVERFLYGLDEGIERNISLFVQNTVSDISKEIIGKLQMTPADLQMLSDDASNAEKAFLKRLRNDQFEEIRSQSRKEIEDMVEFMPKSELATMAEALVNLTSLKRRVSRGMETVGGPIDVAVISRSDGFIWVKRKHYFEPELNLRYAHRVREQAEAKGGRYGIETIADASTRPRGGAVRAAPRRKAAG